MHTPLAELSFAAIDFESAGAAPGETDCPVQVGIVRVEKLFAPESHFCSYIACSRPVHWSAAKVHGITTQHLAGAPSMTELWPHFKEQLSNCVVIGHNPATEMRFLRSFPGHNFRPWLDTLSLARRALPNCESHALGAVCETLGIVEEVQGMVAHKSWHDAHFDAAASLVLLRSIIRGLQMENNTLSSIAFAVKGT